MGGVLGLNMAKRGFIVEPSAAVFSVLHDELNDEPKLCLVVDWGGGTLDVSALMAFKVEQGWKVQFVLLVSEKRARLKNRVL